MTHISPKPCNNCSCDDTLIPTGCRGFIDKSACSLWWGFEAGTDYVTNERLINPFEAKVELINENGDVLELISTEFSGQILILAGQTGGKYRLSYKCKENSEYVIKEALTLTGPCPLGLDLDTKLGTYCGPCSTDYDADCNIYDHNNCPIGTRYNLPECSTNTMPNIRIIPYASTMMTWAPSGSKCGLSSVKVDGQELLDLSDFNFNGSDGPRGFNVSYQGSNAIYCEDYGPQFTTCISVTKPLPLTQDFFILEVENTCGAKATLKEPVPCSLKAEYVSVSLPTITPVNFEWISTKTYIPADYYQTTGTDVITYKNNISYSIPGTIVYNIYDRNYYGVKVGSGTHYSEYTYDSNISSNDPCYFSHDYYRIIEICDFDIFLFASGNVFYALKARPTKKMGDYYSDIPPIYRYGSCQDSGNILDPDDDCFSRCDFLRSMAIQLEFFNEYTLAGGSCAPNLVIRQPNHNGPYFGSEVAIATAGEKLADGEYPKRFLCPGDSKNLKWETHRSSRSYDHTNYSMSGPLIGSNFNPYSHGFLLSLADETWVSSISIIVNGPNVPDLSSIQILPAYIL